MLKINDFREKPRIPGSPSSPGIYNYLIINPPQFNKFTLQRYIKNITSPNKI